MTSSIKLLFLLCSATISMLYNTCNTNSNPSVQFVQKQFDTDLGILNYNILNPSKANEKIPLILFLHGAGERGNDNEAQLVHIAPILSSKEQLKANPAILVFPQCPAEDYWAPVDVNEGIWTIPNIKEPTLPMQKVIELMESLLEHPNVDLNRVYVAGLSMGGFGTLDLLSLRPEWFAAAVAICGGGSLEESAAYQHLPLWLFHGAKDGVVPVSLSRDLHKHLKEKNAPIRYTEYPEGNHLVWNQAFEDPKTLEWLFSKTKEK